MTFKCSVPAVPTVQADDACVRITRWDFEPGAATGRHTHGWPYVVVMLTDAVMAIDQEGRLSETALEVGQVYRRPAGVDHDVSNAGDAPMAFLEIEFKRLAAVAFG